MNVLSYLKSLIGSFRKATLLDEARLTATSLKLQAIPAYEDAKKAFPKSKFASDTAQKLAKDFGNKLGTREGLIEGIATRLAQALAVVEHITEQIEKNFEDTTVSEGISALKLNMLKILDAGSSVNRYSLHLLNYIYVHESAAASGEADYVKEHISAGQTAYIVDNFSEFCNLLEVLGTDVKNVDRLLDTIPDVSFGRDPEATIAMLGEHKLNPLNFRAGMINRFPLHNFFYRLGLHAAEIQATRYKEVVEIKQTLELRLLNLESLQRKSPDPRLEKEIAYTQSRVDRLSKEIRNYEESVK
jgi:hypothetical protein